MIAVFLALGLGILMGSVVLDQAYLKRLNDRVEHLSEQASERRAEIAALNDRITTFQAFAEEAELRLVGGSLQGEDVVAIELEGTADGVLGDLETSIGRSGGELVTRMTLTDRFALTDQVERDQLALALGSVESSPGPLRAEAAAALGAQVAAAAARDPVRGRTVTERLESLVTRLQEAGFLGIDSGDSGLVPAGALFVVLGGAPDEEHPWAVDLGMDLATAIADGGGPVVAGEPTQSRWDFVASVRDDGKASTQVATVDNVETVPGRIAAVLALDEADRGAVGHYGAGGERVIPEVPAGG